ncbi:MAG TPA: DUF6516 family protein [Acidobacteriaceae bacterium]
MRKFVDEVALVSCASGPGIIREEAWEDETGKVVRYNLAFINHFLYPRDNGRVLGYDNAHGTHHRHFFGTVEAVSVTSFAEVASRFYEEVKGLRKRKP